MDRQGANAARECSAPIFAPGALAGLVWPFARIFPSTFGEPGGRECVEGGRCLGMELAEIGHLQNMCHAVTEEGI